MRPFPRILPLVTLSLLALAWSFLAFAGSPRGEKICAMGDAGAGEPAQYRVAKAMASVGCTDVLVLGDNIYPDGVTGPGDPQWETKFRRPYAPLLALGARFHPILGNHDHRQAPGAQIDYSKVEPQWMFPAATYDFRLAGGSACFFALDTTVVDDSQVAWLRGELARAPAACRWKIALGHHPVVSSGAHGPTGGTVETLLRPALAGVDLYLSGHDHSFGDEGDFPPDVAQPAIRVRQLVVGTGGAELYPVREHDSADLRHAESAHGFVVLEPRRRALAFSFVRVEDDGTAKVAYQAAIKK